MEILQNEKLVQQSIADKAEKEQPEVAQYPDEIREIEEPVNDPLQDDPSPDEMGNKKRKRKDKKTKKAAAMAATLAESGARNDDLYDQILLAVVGVLDEVKSQGNVAAWIRAGGLWGLPRAATPTDPDDPASQDISATVAPGTGDGERDCKRTKAADELSSLPTGNDALSTAAVLPARSDLPVSDSTSRSVDTPASSPMWFEDPTTVRYWVDRGKRVLEEMGIPILHGIER